MKSLTFSDIVRSHRRSGLLVALPPVTLYCLAAAVALPLLVLALHDGPGTHLAAAMLPLLLILALPLCAGTPGRLDVAARFDAALLREPLEQALAALGYVPAPAAAPHMRYVRRAPASWRARVQEVHVRMDPHGLAVAGPIPTLRILQGVLASTPEPALTPPSANAGQDVSARETVAAALQISDNAQRVAGMAE